MVWIQLGKSLSISFKIIVFEKEVLTLQLKLLRVMFTKDHFFRQPESRFEHMKDALAELIRRKRNDPTCVTFLTPESEELYAQWNENMCDVRTYAWCSNVPGIALSLDEEYEYPWQAIDEVSDQDAFISKMVERICREYGVREDDGWELTDISDDSFNDIYLFIEPSKWDEAKKIVDSYLSKPFFKEVFTPTYDEGRYMISGNFCTLSEKGHFFQRRKIRKQNKVLNKNFEALIKALTPTLSWI